MHIYARNITGPISPLHNTAEQHKYINKYPKTDFAEIVQYWKNLLRERPVWEESWGNVCNPIRKSKTPVKNSTLTSHGN